MYKAGAHDKSSPFVEIWGGVDFTSNSTFGFTQATFAPYGLHASGLRFGLFSGIGRYHYNDEWLGRIRGTVIDTDVMLGYAWVTSNASLSLYGGVNAINHDLSPFDAFNVVQGTEIGFRGKGELSMAPTPNTMLYVHGSYSTAFNTYYAVGRYGVDVTPGRFVYVGPEVTVLGDDSYDQYRLGGHITVTGFGPIKVVLSGGFAHDERNGDQGYGTLNVGFSF